MHMELSFFIYDELILINKLNIHISNIIINNLPISVPNSYVTSYNYSLVFI